MTGIEEVLGVALGEMHLSLGDFESLTLPEFEQARKAFLEVERLRERNEWERLSMLGVFVLQPYSKKKLRPSDILDVRRIFGDAGKRQDATGSTPERFARVLQKSNTNKK